MTLFSLLMYVAIIIIIIKHNNDDDDGDEGDDDHDVLQIPIHSNSFPSRTFRFSSVDTTFPLEKNMMDTARNLTN